MCSLVPSKTIQVDLDQLKGFYLQKFGTQKLLGEMASMYIFYSFLHFF